VVAVELPRLGAGTTPEVVSPSQLEAQVFLLCAWGAPQEAWRLLKSLQPRVGPYDLHLHRED